MAILSIEQFVYNKVKNNRPLKSALRFLYQSFFYLPSLLSKKFHVAAEYKCKVVEGRFGFHDRASVNEHGLVISHENIHGLERGVAKSADIFVFDLFTEEKKRVVTTHCFNNQQGSLVTWFDNDSIIYNDMDDDSPKTVIRNINGKFIDSIDGHFFSVSKNSKYISDNGLFLPSFITLEPKIILYICKILKLCL